MAANRTIRLTGLGTSMTDRIDDLKALSEAVDREEEREEINKFIQVLENTRDECKNFCRAWSRSFNVED
jgi:uncharacterized protein (UPF0305 family)